MIGRRLFLKGGAAAVTVRGGNPPMRPDQIANLPQTRAGSGPAPSSPFLRARSLVVFGPSGSIILENSFGATLIRLDGVTNAQLFYANTGSATQGALIASIANQSGTDSFGNAFVGTAGGGFVTYIKVGATFIAFAHEGNNLLALTATAVGGPYTQQGSVIGYNPTSNAGQLNMPQTIIGTSNASTTDLLEVQGVAALLDHAFPAGVAATSQLLSNSGGLATVYGSGQQARLSTGRLASVSAVTVTQATFTSLFNATIQGGEAIAGAKYKATAYGFGQWGSTVQDLVFGIRFGATDATTIGTTPDINSASFAASALFRWKAEAELTCVTTGVTATWVANITGFVTQTANSILVGTAGTNSISFTGGTGSGTVTLDSTVNEIFGISAHWAAVTGAPTLTAVSGIMERIA